jgi:hypothetical protein
VSRCLSDDALARVQAELASAAERAHLAACAACTGRYRQQRRELHLITQVLHDPPEPRMRPARPRPRRWLPAAIGLSAAALALLIWVEVLVWRVVTPPPPTMQAQDVAAILADVSASLFPISGDPTPATSQDPASSLEAMAEELDRTLSGGRP